MFNAKKAFKNDGLIRVYIINGAILLILGIVMAVLYKDLLVYIWFFLAGLTAFVLLLMRNLYLKNFMKAKTENIQGTVKNTFYYRGSKVVTLEYIYNDKAYKRRILLNYTKTTKFIDKGREINLVINTEKPKRVLLSDVYLD